MIMVCDKSSHDNLLCAVKFQGNVPWKRSSIDFELISEVKLILEKK